MIRLVNEPIPDPSVDLESEIVGLAAVPQHKPFDVTAAPLSDDTVPPPEAVSDEVADAAAVVTVANAVVVNSISEP